MSKTRERVIKNSYKPLEGIGELIKKFFGNNNDAYAKDDDLEREVNEIMAMQDSDFINKQEKIVSATEENNAGENKNGKIDVRASKREETVEFKEKERDEER